MKLNPSNLHRGIRLFASHIHLSNFWSFLLDTATRLLFILTFAFQIIVLPVYAEEKSDKDENEGKRNIEMIKDDQKLCQSLEKEFTDKLAEAKTGCALAGFREIGGDSDNFLLKCLEKFKTCLNQPETGHKKMISDIIAFKDGKLEDPDYQKTESFKLKKAAYEVLLAKEKNKRKYEDGKNPVSAETETSLKRKARRLLKQYAVEYSDRTTGFDEGIFAGESYTRDRDSYREMDDILKEIEDLWGECDGMRGSKTEDLKSLIEMREKKRDKIKEHKSKLEDAVKEMDKEIAEKKEATIENEEELQQVGKTAEEAQEKVKVEASGAHNQFSDNILISYQELVKRRHERWQVLDEIEAEKKTLKVKCSKTASEDLVAWITAVKSGFIKIPSNERYSFINSKVVKQRQSFYDKCVRENSDKLFKLEADEKRIHKITLDLDELTTQQLKENSERLKQAEEQANYAALKIEKDKNQAMINVLTKNRKQVEDISNLYQKRNEKEYELRKQEVLLETQDFKIEENTKELEKALNALNRNKKEPDYSGMKALIGEDLKHRFTTAKTACCKDASNTKLSDPDDESLKQSIEKNMVNICKDVTSKESLINEIYPEKKANSDNSAGTEVLKELSTEIKK